MDRFMDFVTRKVKVPLMIDSTDAAVIELALAQVPGQGHRQLDQPGGRRGALRARRPAAQDLRRGGGGGLHRRGQAAGHGGHRGSASSRSPSAPTTLLTEKYGLARARHHLRLRSSFPVGTGDANYIGLGGRDHRGRARDQGALPRVQDDPRHLQRVLRAARRRGARCSTRSSSTTAPRRASTTPSSTARSSSATPRSPRRSARSPRT